MTTVDLQVTMQEFLEDWVQKDLGISGYVKVVPSRIVQEYPKLYLHFHVSICLFPASEEEK